MSLFSVVLTLSNGVKFPLGYILAQKYLLISSLDQTLWRSALLATFNVPDVLVLDTKYRKLVKS